MKQIEVVAAIIYDNEKFFATQRGYGEFEGLWEFPGGKIEKGESRENALRREIQEELGIDISIDRFVCTTDFDYPSFHLAMHCYLWFFFTLVESFYLLVPFFFLAVLIRLFHTSCVL